MFPSEDAFSETDAAQRRDPGAAVDLPAEFGRYRIRRKIGAGGMGAVYLAHDTQLQRDVALKVPRFTPEDGPQVLERFYREARAAAALHHPNLCPVFDVGQIGGIHFLTMAYIEGRPLSALRSANVERLSPRQVATLVRKIATALHEAHARGIIHRDLKPANIMIDARKEPVIMDFGLARLSGRGDPRLTQTGAIMGTPAYMSPEQVHGHVEQIGPKSDIYSLGVILYELLTGRLPFEGSLGAILGKIITVEPPSLSSVRPDVDPDLERICQKAMSKDPDARYATMADFAAALGAYVRAAGSRPPGSSGTAVTPKPNSANPSTGGRANRAARAGPPPLPSNSSAVASIPQPASTSALGGRPAFRRWWIAAACGTLAVIAAGVFLAVAFVRIGAGEKAGPETASDAGGQPATSAASVPEPASRLGAAPAGGPQASPGAHRTVDRLASGYGEALDALADELNSRFDGDSLVIAWLIDESDSLSADRSELRGVLPRLYQAATYPSVVYSFGKSLHEQISAPSPDLTAVVDAIDRVPSDASGVENLCSAVIGVLTRHASSSNSDRLVLVVVTDESGDDGQDLERAIDLARQHKAAVFILGREAAFGTAQQLVRWIDPKTRRVEWLPTSRGPETALPEILQFNGFRTRSEAYGSGFSPYEQVRMCSETGGTFFQLPALDQLVTSASDAQQARSRLEAYAPLLASRTHYVRDRDGSPFRKSLTEVIGKLDPKRLKLLPAPETQSFSTVQTEYAPQLLELSRQVAVLLFQVETCQQQVELLLPLRDAEPSKRWQANYDLTRAQLSLYRARLDQYALELATLRRDGPPPDLIQGATRWTLREQLGTPTAKARPPTTLRQRIEEATGLLKVVSTLHPDTPWSRVAEAELSRVELSLTATPR